MKAAGIVFKFSNGNVQPIEFKNITCHLIFDVNMNYTMKAHFIEGGHPTDPPEETPVYALVMLV